MRQSYGCTIVRPLRQGVGQEGRVPGDCALDSSSIAAIGSLQQQLAQQQWDFAVAAKMQDVARAQGDAVVAQLEAATAMAPQISGGDGVSRGVDVLA